MTKEEAYQKVKEMLDEDYAHDPSIRIVMIDEYAIETEFGWSFSYQNYDYWVGKNENTMLVGQGPVLVDKDFDLIIMTGSRLPSSAQIEIYKKHRGDVEGFEREVGDTPYWIPPG